MIGRILRLLAKAVRGFRNSDLYRRAFTAKRFPENSEARKPKMPTIGDRADVDVRRVSSDEFIMTVAKGRGQLEGMQEQLDMELQKHRQEHNYVLDDNKRPDLGEIQKEELMERLDEVHEKIKDE